jgi:hypothetical protein
MGPLCTWRHYKCATLSELDSGPGGINRCHNVDRTMSNTGFCHTTLEHLILIAKELSIYLSMAL